MWHQRSSVQSALLAAVAILALSGSAQVASAAAPDYKYDKAEMDRKLSETIQICERPSNEACAQDWIDKVGNVRDYVDIVCNKLEFAQIVTGDDAIGKEYGDLNVKRLGWNARHINIAKKFPWKEFQKPTLRRRFMIMTSELTLEDDKERAELASLAQAQADAFFAAKACPSSNVSGGANPCLQAGEQAVADVMRDPSASYEYKQAVWRAWYEATSAALVGNYSRFVSLTNKAARQSGFRDAGEAEYSANYDWQDPTRVVLAVYDTILDLYKQLHAYVRHKISLKYPGKFDPKGCLPMHITGADQWAMVLHLPDSDYPYPAAKATFNLSQQLERKYGRNFTSLVKVAEEFFTSMGLPNMRPAFWEKSDFLPPANPSIPKGCNPSAWDIGGHEDYRIMMCGKINRDDFFTIHHEMGHILYFMAYYRMPREFRSAANGGFQEAIGDTIAMSVDTTTHYTKLGLAKSSDPSHEENINSLFTTALERVTFLPYAMAMSMFRWAVFGSKTEVKYNELWWGLNRKYMGICPPVNRPQKGLDAGAKFHTAIDYSFSSYFVSHVLQFTFHKRLCQLSGHVGPINRCDFYKSNKAGEKLWKMLQAGRSRPWQEIMAEFTGSNEGLQSTALLEYFKPLHDWLRDYNAKNRVPIGWPTTVAPQDVLKGVSL